MESRSKIAEQAIYKSDLEFTLIDQNQAQVNSPVFTATFEMTAPAIAQAVCQGLSSAAQTISIKYFNNHLMQMFGGKFNIQLCSDKELSSCTDESLSKVITDSIDSINSGKLFSFEPPYSIRLTNSIVDDQNALFTWKVSQRLYSYNALDKLNEEKIEFINESEHRFVDKPHTTRFSYDAFSNPVRITYEYKSYTSPSEEHLRQLEALVIGYVSENKKCQPVLKSVISKDYNQALRRACFGGDLELVLMLFKFDEGDNHLNLDLNQASSNGKTPLDYANASGNERLIKLLAINGAKTKDELRFSLVDTNRREVMDANKRNTSRRADFSHGSFEQQSGFPSPSRNGIFASGVSHNQPYNLLEMVERINRENRERRDRLERERFEREHRERMRLNEERSQRMNMMTPGVHSSSFSRPMHLNSIFSHDQSTPGSQYGASAGLGWSSPHSNNDDSMHNFDPYSPSSFNRGFHKF